MSSLFDAVEMAPRDPILGLNEQFVADPNPAKVNLGVGVYYDENGKLPLLRCVREAEKMMMEAPQPRGYLPIDGIAAYDAATQALVFGDAAARREGRIATVQAVGGTGGLKVGADLLQAPEPVGARPDQRAELGEPPRPVRRRRLRGRHLPLLRRRHQGRRLRGDARRPGGRGAGDDRRPARLLPQPDRLRPLARAMAAGGRAARLARGSCPFLDMAYQGFGDGIAEDARAVQLCLDAGLDFFVATSYSKSFSLYGERAGALSVVCASKDAATRVLSQLKRVIRTNYSNPPTHGAAAITTVLSTPALRAMWEDELAGMRERIKRMRVELQRRLVAAGAAHRHRLHHPPARHVQLLRPRARRRCSACAASSGSTASIPAASAWPPSTIATSTPSSRRSRASPRRLQHDALRVVRSAARAAEPVLGVRERFVEALQPPAVAVRAHAERAPRLGRARADAPARQGLREAAVRHPLDRRRRHRGRRARAGRDREAVLPAAPLQALHRRPADAAAAEEAADRARRRAALGPPLDAAARDGSRAAQGPQGLHDRLDRRAHGAREQGPVPPRRLRRLRAGVHPLRSAPRST